MEYIRSDRKKNTEIREHLTIPNIVNEIEKNQNNWVKHLQRMNKNRIPLQEFKYRPAGRRQSGNPNRRWKDQLHLESTNRLRSLKLNCSEKTRQSSMLHNVSKYQEEGVLRRGPSSLELGTSPSRPVLRLRHLMFDVNKLRCP
jgi:hypothetical protein